MMKNKQELKMVDEIIKSIGDVENVITSMHCSTRIRFTLKNDSLANVEKIRKIDGVMGAQWKAGQLQIIVGQKVGRIYEMMTNRYPLNADGEVADDYDEKQKLSASSILDFLAGCLSPALPCILGGGLMKGFIALFVMIGWIIPETDFHQFLVVVSDAPFYFLPFLLAYTSAKKFKTDILMSMAVAGMMMYPTIINGGDAFQIGLLSIPLARYSGSVIPIILSVWVLKYVYKYVNKVIPVFLRMLFAPIIVFFVMGIISLAITGPIGFYLSKYVADGVNMLFDFSPIIAGFVVGITRQFIVFTGMHLSLTAIILSNIENNGWDPLIAIYGISALAVAGASLGAFMKLRKKSNKEIALSACISAVLGITEPGLYGVLVRFKWPFISASIASGIGGAISAALGGRGYMISTPSVLSLAIFGDTTLIVAMCYVISFAVALILTYAVRFDEDTEKSEKALETEKKLVLKVKDTATNKDTPVASPVRGTVVSLSQVGDDTFSQGMLGKGAAIIPSEGTIYAPVTGTISMVFPTGHAIGLVTENGDEILVHIGIDTVELQGKGFEINIRKGQRVKAGERLGSFDLDFLKEAGYDPTVIVLKTSVERELVESEEKNTTPENLIYTIV